MTGQAITDEQAGNLRRRFTAGLHTLEMCLRRYAPLPSDDAENAALLLRGLARGTSTSEDFAKQVYGFAHKTPEGES